MATHHFLVAAFIYLLLSTATPTTNIFNCKLDTHTHTTTAGHVHWQNGKSDFETETEAGIEVYAPMPHAVANHKNCQSHCH